MFVRIGDDVHMWHLWIGQLCQDLDALYGYVQIRRSEGGVALALILSDGRSYNRELQGEPELLPRIVASQLANLIAGIEADTLAPDEEDVAIPDATEPAKAVVPAPVVAPPRPRAAAPQSDLGLRVGGEVGLEFRSIHGALAGLSVRGASRVDSGFALVRVRVAALGGYAYRRGDFELVAAAGITVEPFFVQRNGGREALARGVGDEQRAAFLLGGVARVAPGFRRMVTPEVAFRFGPALEIGGSAIPSADGGVARVRTIDGTSARDLFRAGGLEVFVGLDLGLWWKVGR